MYLILWKYHVKEEKQAEYEQIYSPAGAWAELFQKAAGYLGTDLLHDEVNPLRYITVDRWAHKQDYDTFMSQWNEKYNALDQQCQGLTESESLLGRWNTVQIIE